MSECVGESSKKRRLWPTRGCCAMVKKYSDSNKALSPYSNTFIFLMHYFIGWMKKRRVFCLWYFEF